MYRNEASAACFVVAIMLMCIILLASIFGKNDDAFKSATMNLLILNWITTLVIGGLLLRDGHRS